MARRVLAWECGYCGELKKTENIANRHEASCLKNPNAKNCVLCTHSYKQTLYGNSILVCKEKKVTCSRAISAKCDDFERR
jgi:hypothetical protein